MTDNRHTWDEKCPGHNQNLSDDDSSSFGSGPNLRLMESPTITRKAAGNIPSMKQEDVEGENTYPSGLPDLKLLASANFSTDSLPDSTPLSNQIFTPITPTFAPNHSSLNNANLESDINTTVYSKRRYSNLSLSNSPLVQPPSTSQLRASTSSRTRPKSAIFMMDSNNYAISEDGSPIESPVNNTPRARNSINFSLKSSYLPPTIIGPPTGPSSNIPSRSTSPSRPPSPSRTNRQYRSKSPIRRSSSPTKSYQPFNFKPQEIMLHNNGSSQSLQVKPAHRKGHKYKHSSVSMNLFQEPPPALKANNQLLAIPDLYPIPNFKESMSSIQSTQKLKLFWSLCHSILSLVVFLTGFQFKLPSLSTLAHLVFYDSLGSLVIVFVDIMSNFEVWNNSSITYPFGLGRLEVLVGFALSASLIMVGSDLVSHFFEEFIILLVVKDVSVEHDGEQHQSHHIHGETGHQVNWFIYEAILIITALMTLITSNYILAYDRINDMISSSDDTSNSIKSKSGKSRIKGGILDIQEKEFQKSLFTNLQRFTKVWAKNPTHLLTLSYSIYLMIVPLMPSTVISQTTIDINEATSLIVALLLCYTGWKLVKSLGGILLLSYPYSDYDYHVLKSTIIDMILSLDFYKQSYNIEKLFITKFNYELFVVGINITMKGGSNDDESRLRFEINRIIKNSIEETEFNGKNSKIEVTIDINRF